MSEDLKVPVSQTIKYADGSETTVYYNALGEKMSEEVQAEESAEVVEPQAPVETPEAEAAPEAVEAPEESAE